jgi:hypothetical protein
VRRVLHQGFKVVFVVFISLIFTGRTQAEYQFGFDIFTSNGPYYDDSRLQFSVVVSNGQNHVDFTFYNNSSLNSSVARIYFDDGSLLGISNIASSSGVSFHEGAPGNNMPGGSLIGFYADREFTIGADNPEPQNGVNAPPPGMEWVKVGFDLVNGGTLEGVIQELFTGELKIGLHIISIDGPPSSSESAIMVIPEPATLCLLAAGAALALRKHKR